MRERRMIKQDGMNAQDGKQDSISVGRGQDRPDELVGEQLKYSSTAWIATGQSSRSTTGPVEQELVCNDGTLD